MWDTYYEHRRAVNLGFNGDGTEEVLWRLQHEEIDGIRPKVAVVMIGTNNSGTRKAPPEQTAAGVQAILTVLRAHLPETKILWSTDGLPERAPGLPLHTAFVLTMEWRGLSRVCRMSVS